MSAFTKQHYLEHEVLAEVDEALIEDKKERSEVKTKVEEEPKLKALPSVLRSMGALVLVASAATFMLQQWDTMDHIFRYFSFLGFTLTLCAAGFFCGLRIKEDKGARTFLAVTAAIIPVHFCQLGALIYSKVGPAAHVPSLFLWKAPDLLTAFLTTGAGLFALVPITLIAFSALARNRAAAITTAYLAANAVLLVPTREPGLIGIMALLSFLGIAYFERERLAVDSSLTTPEGTLSRALLYVPVALLLGRSLNLYAIDQLFISMMNAIAAIALFRFLPRAIKEKELAKGIQVMSVIPAFVSYFAFANVIAEHVYIAPEFMIPFRFLPMSGILFLMSFCSIGNGSGFRRCGILLGVVTVIAQLAFYPGIVSSFLCVFVGLFSAAYGAAIEEKGTFALGLFGLVCGLGYHLKYALEIAAYSPWVSLAIVGILTVLASSYIERNYREILFKMKAFKGRLSSWN